MYQQLTVKTKIKNVPLKIAQKNKYIGENTTKNVQSMYAETKKDGRMKSMI